jgi:ATP-dependent Clp protease ATP-binding subunit ClpC
VIIKPVEFEKPKNKEKRSGTSPSKMGRFTDDGRLILSMAQEATETLGNPKIELEHLLLAMVRHKNCGAYRILTDLQINEVEVMQQFKQQPTHHPNLMNPDLSENLKKCLELAVDTARRFGHHHIDTEHLLIGVMCVNKPEIGSILAHFGIDAKTVIKRAEEVLKQRPDDSEKDNQ